MVSEDIPLDSLRWVLTKRAWWLNGTPEAPLGHALIFARRYDEDGNPDGCVYTLITSQRSRYAEDGTRQDAETIALHPLPDDDLQGLVTACLKQDRDVIDATLHVAEPSFVCPENYIAGLTQAYRELIAGEQVPK